MRNPIPRVLALPALGVAALLALGGCAAMTAETDVPTHSGTPVVIATTTWQAAFAKAAGATDITIIAPASSQHAAEYEPTPSDLTVLSGADFVLYSEFESFAPAITEAADSDAQVVAVNADNTPANIIAEVTRLSELFGTVNEGHSWVEEFTATVNTLEADIQDALGNHPDPVIVSQVFTMWLAEMISTNVTSYGPAQLTASEVLELTRSEPRLVLANSHMAAGVILPDSAAIQINVVNYPDESLDIFALYKSNVEKVIAGLNGHAMDDTTEGGHGH